MGEASGAGDRKVPLDQLYAASSVDADSGVWLLATRCVAAHAALAEPTAADAQNPKGDYSHALVALASHTHPESSLCVFLEIFRSQERRPRLRRLLLGSPSLSLSLSLSQERVFSSIRLYRCALSPFEGCGALDRKKKQSPLSAAVCRDGLKLPCRDVDACCTLIAASEEMQSFSRRWHALNAAAADAVTPTDPAADAAAAEPVDSHAALRCDAGLALFDLRELWRPAVAVARARELAALPALDDDEESSQKRAAGDEAVTPVGSAAWRGVWLDRDAQRVRGVARRYEQLEEAITGALALDTCWASLQPVFDGKRLMTELAVPKGPWVGVLPHAQKKWQLTHPHTDADAVKAHLLETLADLEANKNAAPNKKQHPQVPLASSASGKKKRRH